jgi:two-component SAPR family response regulator
MRFKVAIIDDSPDDTILIKKLLQKFDVIVESYASSVEFGHCKTPNEFDFVFIDYNINGGAGAEAILRALTVNTLVKIVLISNSDDHLRSDKKYEDNPVIWGLLSKDNPVEISEWMENRIYEYLHPECLI